MFSFTDKMKSLNCKAGHGKVCSKLRHKHYYEVKDAMIMCTNEMNCDSSEQKYAHLSNGLIQNFEIHYTFRI